MAFITTLTRDSAVTTTVYTLSNDRRSVAGVRSWERLQWFVRERPVTEVVLDSAALPPLADPDGLVTELRRRFPSLGIVLIARPDLDPLMLFRLGRAGIADLTVVPLDDLARGVRRGVERSAARGTRALVLRAIGMRLPTTTVEVVRAALDGAVLGWTADGLAKHCGWTRAHLGVRLRARGLPSAGHLLLWAKLLHAGRWLAEPGRTAESVSRQLEYSSGAAFRRALKNYLRLTPTELVEAGGFGVVAQRFLDVCGLDDTVGDQLSVA